MALLTHVDGAFFVCRCTADLRRETAYFVAVRCGTALGTYTPALAKGNKDRMLIIQGALHKQLSSYIKVYQPKHWFYEGQTGGQYSGTSIRQYLIEQRPPTSYLIS